MIKITAKIALKVAKTILNIENKSRNKYLHGPCLSFEVICWPNVPSDNFGDPVKCLGPPPPCAILYDSSFSGIISGLDTLEVVCLCRELTNFHP